MKVVLRQTNKRLYYAGPEEWTTDSSGAVDFEEVERALVLAREARLEGVEVVLAYDDPLCDLVLPVEAGRSREPQRHP